MKCQLGVYEKALPAEIPLTEKLLIAKECGFDFFELSIDESEERLSRLCWSREQALTLRAAAEKANIGLDTLCLSAHRKYPLGSADPALRKRAEEIFEGALQLAGTLGVRIIQLAGYHVYYEPPAPESEPLFLAGLQRWAQAAAARGVMLGLETMETPFMNTVEKAMAFVRAVASPWLQVYPDVGNVYNGSKAPLQDLLTGRGHIVAAHLKETAPGVFRNLFPGEGQVDFKKAVETLVSMGVTKFNAECWHRPGEDFISRLRQVQAFFALLLERSAPCSPHF